MASISLSTANPRPDLSELAEQATTKLDQAPQQFVPWLAKAAARIGLDLSSLVKNPKLNDQLGQLAQLATTVHRGVGEILGNSASQALWETNQNQYSLDAIETMADVSRRFDVLFKRQDLASLTELLKSDKVLDILNKPLSYDDYRNVNPLVATVYEHYTNSELNSSFVDQAALVLRDTNRILNSRSVDPVNLFENQPSGLDAIIQMVEDIDPNLSTFVMLLRDTPNLLLAWMESSTVRCETTLKHLMQIYLNSGDEDLMKEFQAAFIKALPAIREFYPDIEAKVLTRHPFSTNHTGTQRLKDELLNTCAAPQS